MYGTDGDRLTGYIKTPKRTKRQMYQRDVRSDGRRLTGYIKTPKRTKRQMYQRDVRSDGHRLTGYIKRQNVQNGKCINSS